MVRIGVVGAGKIAERHLNAYRHLPGVEVALTDVAFDVAATKAQTFNVPHLRSLEEMLDQGFDAIDVCVPTRYHHEIVIAALEAGKHVFCEKPLCLTVDEALDIQRLASERDLAVSVGYLYRFHPSFQLVKRVLDDGIIGRPYFGTFRLGGRGSAAIWKHDANTGGGAALEMLVHMLDLALWLLGDFETSEVHVLDTILRSRVIAGKEAEATAEDLVSLSLIRPDAHVVCEADLLTPSYMNHIEVQAAEGSVFASILHYFPTIVYCREARDIFNQGNNFFNFEQVNLFELELGAFVQSLREGTVSRDSVDDAIRILRVLESVSHRRQAVG